MWTIEFSLTGQGMSQKEEVRMIDIHTGITAMLKLEELIFTKCNRREMTFY